MKLSNSLRVEERGSLAPLGIGLALLSLTVVVAAASATSLFLLDRRLSTLAEFTALSVVSNGESAEDYLARSAPVGFTNLTVAADSMEDGLTEQVTLCAIWDAPIKGMIPLPSRLICESGLARNG